MALAFGESHWDYLPDLVQNFIEYLAARAVHLEQMQAVCKSIHLYNEWHSQKISQEISIFNPLFIESQVCPNCFKNFSPEIVLSKHISVCRDFHQGFEGLEAEIGFYRSFYDDAYDDEYIDEPIDF